MGEQVMSSSSLRIDAPITCQFMGCGRVARGASSLCIDHGGGRRCQEQDCHKGAEGTAYYCKAHGGVQRCEHLGCFKRARGRTNFCVAHGGGQRCSHEGCVRAVMRYGLCFRHGPGKRCREESCTKSAEGLYGRHCIAHGPGKRCREENCTKSAEGLYGHCIAHGGVRRCDHFGTQFVIGPAVGGRRCSQEGWGSTVRGVSGLCIQHGDGRRLEYFWSTNGAEGLVDFFAALAVHGGAELCVGHDGGKRCAFPECAKSARWGTDFCVSHCGGKRCKSEGCGKSAWESTDFCEAHGGGKRCSWGQRESDVGQGEGPCYSFARGERGLCASHGALYGSGKMGSWGGATLEPMVQDSEPSEPERMEEAVAAAEEMDLISKLDGPCYSFSRAWQAGQMGSSTVSFQNYDTTATLGPQSWIPWTMVLDPKSSKLEKVEEAVSEAKAMN